MAATTGVNKCCGLCTITGTEAGSCSEQESGYLCVTKLTRYDEGRGPLGVHCLRICTLLQEEVHTLFRPIVCSANLELGLGLGLGLALPSPTQPNPAPNPTQPNPMQPSA